MATKKKLDWKVEELDYKNKKTKVHYFQNKEAAAEATRNILKSGNGANVYYRDEELTSGWSKRGSYIPNPIWAKEEMKLRKQLSRKKIRITPKQPKIR